MSRIVAGGVRVGCTGICPAVRAAPVTGNRSEIKRFGGAVVGRPGACGCRPIAAHRERESEQETKGVSQCIHEGDSIENLKVTAPSKKTLRCRTTTTESYPMKGIGAIQKKWNRPKGPCYNEEVMPGGLRRASKPLPRRAAGVRARGLPTGPRDRFCLLPGEKSLPDCFSNPRRSAAIR